MTIRELIKQLEETPEKYKDLQVRAIGDFAHDIQWKNVDVWEPDYDPDEPMPDDAVVTLYWDGVERR